MNNTRLALWGGVAAGLLTACADPITDVQIRDWEPEVAAPILNTSFTLRDALRETEFAEHIAEDEDSALRLKVTQELFDVRPVEALDLPALVIPLLDTVTVTDFGEGGLDAGVSRLDMRFGHLVTVFRNDTPVEATVTVTSDGILLGARTLARTLTVPAGQTVRDSVGIDLASVRADANDELTVRYASVDASGGHVPMTYGVIGFEGSDQVYAEGTLDNIALELGLDSIALDVLESFEPGQLELVGPKATLRISNGTGVPFALVTPRSEAVLRDGSVLPVVTPLTEGYAFDYLAMGSTAAAKTSELVVDGRSGNFVEAINQFPRSLRVELAGRSNPGGLAGPFFLTDEARLRGTFELDAPLSVRFRGFALEEEFEFDASSLREAETVAFRMTIENGFGLDAATQVYFYDAAGATIDSLFAAEQTLLASAVTDESGATVQPTERMTEVELPAERVAALAATHSARVRVRLTSPRDGDGVTRLYYDNQISVKLGARATVRPL